MLQAARQAGILIPTLCDHQDLTPYAGCRFCVVEVSGSRFPLASCALPVSQGMVIKSESPAINRYRKAILRLMLSTYYDHDLLQRKNIPRKERGLLEDTEFMRWVKHYRINLRRYIPHEPRYPVNSDPNPFIRVDLNKCIVCTRCIRACAEIQGRFVWSLADRGIQTHITAGPNTTMLEARCESCGACAAYCPTGALEHKLSYGSPTPNKKVRTTCTYCGVGCQFDLNIREDEDGRQEIIRVTSSPDAPVNGMALCVKGRYGYDFVHHPDRLLKPRVRRYLLEGQPRTKDRGEWVEVDWDTALHITAIKLSSIRDRYSSDSVGIMTSAKCTNEENYLMNKFARQVIGTNSIDHCARL